MSQHALYNGLVVHSRLRPVKHRLRYRVFNMLLDVDALGGAETRLFKVNRAGLLSFHEKDHGDGERLRPWLDGIAERAGFGGQVARYLVLCYPRVFGFVFNPITVYFALDGAGRPVLMIYEVRNTFGEQLSYAVAVDDPDAPVLAHGCAKALFVSPFNTNDGRYDFRIVPPGDQVSVGVSLSVDGDNVLAASFAGTRATLDDGEIVKALMATGWMTAKVVAAIHWEALKLFFKGLRMKRRRKVGVGEVRVHAAEPADSDAERIAAE